MDELTIDREFDDLCPPLTTEEERLLEQSIEADGCLHPIVTWAQHESTILDGHNRYRICRKLERPFKTKALLLSSREEAIAWILRTQLGRRNLGDGQRAMLAAKLANLQPGDNQSTVPQICGTTQAAAAAEFGVSERTVSSAKKVLESGSKPLQKAVESGEVAVSVAAKLAELPKAEQSKAVAKGPEAVKQAVKQYKDEFDTAKLDKQNAKDKKPGSVKKQWDDNDFIEAAGQFAKQIDAAYGNFLKLLEDCHANAGGSSADFDRAKRACHHGKAKSQELLKGVLDGFRVWRPKK